MTDYYVDAAMADDTGDGTTPATAKKTIAAGAALMNGSDTLHVANGTYAETVGIGWPNGGNNSIIGESKLCVIVDLTSISSYWVYALNDSDDGGTLSTLTIKNYYNDTDYAIRLQGADNWTIQDVLAQDNGKLLAITDTSNNANIIRLEASGIKETTGTDLGILINSSGITNFEYCIFRANQNNMMRQIYISGASSTVNFYHCLLTGSNSHIIGMYAAATVSFINSIFAGNVNNIYGTSANLANVTLTNTFLNETTTSTTSATLSGEGYTVTPSQITSHTRRGVILLGVDDTGHFPYAKSLAAAANPKGYHITHHVQTQSLPEVGEAIEYVGLPFDEAKDFLDAGNDFGVHSETHPADLANSPETWDTEVTGAKAKLENYINQIDGYETWTAVAWASPGNSGGADLADRIKTDGFLYGRMIFGAANAMFLEDHAVFYTRSLTSKNIRTADEEKTLSMDKIDMLCEWANGFGGVGELYFHNNDTTFYDPDPVDLPDLLDRIAANGVLIMNAREYLAWLEDNATYSDGAGNAARWAVTFTEDLFDGRLQAGADAIDAGTTIAGVTDIGTLDPWGNACNRTPNIGADQASDENLYRKDAGFNYNEAAYTVRVKKVLPTP